MPSEINSWDSRDSAEAARVFFFSWEDERQKDGREEETACWECLGDADGATDSRNNGSDGVLMGRKRREDERVEDHFFPATEEWAEAV